MNKYELIFFAAAIIAYIACTFTLNIPSYVHVFFALLLLIVLFAAVLLKYQKKFENEKIAEIMKILEIIIIICYFIALTYELFIGNSTSYSPILILIFFVIAICRWFFGKNKD